MSGPLAPNDRFDSTLLSRIEDAGLNASAPPQQRWVDGWLVRFSAGKAKRARCINAVADGRLPVAERLAFCQQVYVCLLYTSPSPRDGLLSRMPSSA